MAVISLTLPLTLGLVSSSPLCVLEDVFFLQCERDYWHVRLTFNVRPSINLTFMCFRRWPFLQCERDYSHVRLTFDVRPSINLTFMCFRR
jgi:hypothetical protein